MKGRIHFVALLCLRVTVSDEGVLKYIKFVARAEHLRPARTSRPTPFAMKNGQNPVSGCY